MRRRMLDPEFFSDPDLVANFDITGRFFYAGLWSAADDSWVFEPNMLGLKMKIFPGDNIDPNILTAYYEKFVSMGKIIVFEIRGRKYAWLKNSPKRQKVDHPSAPALPLPEWVKWYGEGSHDDQGNPLKRHQWHYRILEDVLNNFISVPDTSATCPEQVSDVSPLIEVKLIEVKLSELKDQRDPSPAAQGSLSPEAPAANEQKEKPVAAKGSSDIFFEQIWNLYPIHRDKQKALDLWRKEKLDCLFDEIRDAIDRQNATKKANDAAGTFYPEFPYLHRWLKGRRWEDEIGEEAQTHENHVATDARPAAGAVQSKYPMRCEGDTS